MVGCGVGVAVELIMQKWHLSSEYHSASSDMMGGAGDEARDARIGMHGECWGRRDGPGGAYIEIWGSVVFW